MDAQPRSLSDVAFDYVPALELDDDMSFTTPSQATASSVSGDMDIDLANHPMLPYDNAHVLPGLMGA